MEADGAVARCDFIGVEVLGLRVIVPGQPVLGVIAADAVEGGEEVASESFAGVLADADARPHVLDAIAQVALVAITEEHFVPVVHVKLARRPGEGVVVVVFSFLGVGGGVSIEFVSVLFAEVDGFFGGVHGPFPFLAVVALVDEVRAVGVLEVGVELRVSVHQGRCGVEQQSCLEGQRGGGSGAVVVSGVVPACGQQLGGFGVFVGYEVDTFVVGRARDVHLGGGAVDRHFTLHQHDGAVILQHNLVVVTDKEECLAFEVVEVFGRDVGHAVDVVQHVVAVADAFPDELADVARGVGGGVVAPQRVVGRRGRFAAVGQAFPVEVAHGAVPACDEVVAGRPVGELLGVEIVGYFFVAGQHHLFGLVLRLVDVVYRGRALGHHVQKFAGAQRQAGGCHGQCLV